MEKLIWFRGFSGRDEYRIENNDNKIVFIYVPGNGRVVEKDLEKKDIIQLRTFGLITIAQELFLLDLFINPERWMMKVNEISKYSIADSNHKKISDIDAADDMKAIASFLNHVNTEKGFFRLLCGDRVVAYGEYGDVFIVGAESA